MCDEVVNNRPDIDRLIKDCQSSDPVRSGQLQALGLDETTVEL